MTTSDQALLTAENLGKRYCRDLDVSLRYGLGDLLRAAVGRARPGAQLRAGEFWALREVSFRLGRGECLGVIGPNGAGKSTLVRLLHGRLPLDAGRVVVRGSLTAISELGVGFDPLLSGRENVLHNGMLLGLERNRLEEALADIAAFAELGDWLEAPVYTYSAGMKARLGFAVAAHLDPDVLLLDEVFTVGDLAFRRRCLRHVQDFVGRGRAVLLVSHDLYRVQSLCANALYLEGGRVVFAGDSKEAVSRYLAARREAPPEAGGAAAAAAAADQPVAITGSAVLPVAGGELRTGEPARVVVRYRAHRDCDSVFWGFRVSTADALVQIASAALPPSGEPPCRLAAGAGELSCLIPRLPFTAGTYALRAAIGETGGALLALHGHAEAPCLFTVRRGAAADHLAQISGDLVTLEVELETAAAALVTHA